ncbi:MAG: sulfite exporter TauE/SafE family protein [Alphaproteobacteria bacterium]|nr:sulfite exporter TauE/SafE family protein [Alphaproteobacteria bacterium]
MTWVAGLDIISLALVLAGALFAGFVTGFAGFGTGLVASGLWLHAVPAHNVPPLVLLVSLGAQVASMRYLSIGLKRGAAFLSPLVAGGAAGIPLGVLMLASVEPGDLRIAIGVLMILYVLWQFFGPRKLSGKALTGMAWESLAGLGGGFLGGFAGIPGPVPLIFLQLRGGPREDQRARYLPYSLVMLCVGCVAFAFSGHLDWNVAALAGLCIPATLLGAVIGSRVFLGLDEEQFRKFLGAFLLLAGLSLMPW